MSDGADPPSKPSNAGLASRAFDSLKVDFNTIKTILLTAVAVCVLLSVPLFFMLKNFVTFDALDRYLKLTESVRPKILHTISEELGSGYSKNFIFDATRSADNTMLFYATEKQRVTLSVNAIPVSGDPQPITLQVNGCNVREALGASGEALHLYEFDLTKRLKECGPDEPNLHTLRIVLPNGLPRGTAYQIKCLVLVYERVHEHIEEK